MLARDESSALFAAQTLLAKAQDVRQEIDGVRQAKDIEYIHRMRVASRRMRAALAVFAPCLPERQIRKWTKGIRRITRALGQARDADVQLEFLREFLDSLSDRVDRTGINRLILRIRQHRARCQEDVCGAMDRLAQDALLEDMAARLEQLRARDVRLHVPQASQALYNLAGRAIIAHLDDLLSHAPSLADPQQVDQHHAMRIAAKHLRYTMEIFAPLYDNALEHPISTAKKAQGMLGDIHDCDVWIQHLPLFLEEERRRIYKYLGRAGPIKRIAVGIERLENNRRTRRRQQFSEFAAWWQKYQSAGDWEQLRTIVAAKMPPPPPQLPPDAGAVSG